MTTVSARAVAPVRHDCDIDRLPFRQIFRQMTLPPLQSRLPHAPWLTPATARLPGIQPLDPSDWLIRDEAFAGQMALRDNLIANQPDRVHALLPQVQPAASECLQLVLCALATDPGYRLDDTRATRPDGITVPLDRTQPLKTIGRLTQSDICVMQPGPDGHFLAGAILCFPAGWTLAEKIGHPLGRIHVPVASYDLIVEKRVQRLFDALRPGQILWRANAHLYDDPTLFSPRTEADPRPYVDLSAARYVRSERQTLRRLPESGAVLFGIHTLMVPVDCLDPNQRRTLASIA